MNEQELIKELHAGNLAAFKQLYDATSSMVFNVALRMLQNRQDAEDVTQDVFVQAYKSIRSFKADARLSTWLYRIAVNRSLNHQRDSKRKRWRSLDTDSESGEGASLESLLADDDTPDRIIEKKETEGIVQAAINSLPEQQRVALILHRYEDMPYEEIARVMEVSVASVESRLHRAKQALAKKLLPLRNKL